MKRIIWILTTWTIAIAGCRKAAVDLPATAPTAKTFTKPNYTPPGNSDSILVDASKDGGSWWYPQAPSTGFSAGAPHQGKALADYLRDMGFVVNELPRGATITRELLDKYSKIIRSPAFFGYSSEEIVAYQSFLERPSSLLLLSDHLKYTVNDQLAAYLGLEFEGVYSGIVTSFENHPVTEGVSKLNYIAGSVIRQWDPSKITILGSLKESTADNSPLLGVMGVLNHPNTRTFFMGDVNGLEQLPQPLTANLVNWLFR